MTADAGTRRSGRIWAAGIAIAALTVIVATLLASNDPDGLERVAEDLGFIARAEGAPVEVLPGYTVPFIDEPVVSTIVAGLLGVLLVVAAMWLLGRLLARRRGA